MYDRSRVGRQAHANRSPLGTRHSIEKGFWVKSLDVVSLLASDSQLAMSSGWPTSSVMVTVSIAAIVSGRK
jgi:hypothetical protein